MRLELLRDAPDGEVDAALLITGGNIVRTCQTGDAAYARDAAILAARDRTNSRTGSHSPGKDNPSGVAS